MPPPHGFYPTGLNYSDSCRQAVVDEYDPDLIDEWSGGTSNRAYFYTSRGVAANMQFDYEMNQALNGIMGFCDSIYRTLGPGPIGSFDNGVSVMMNGASEYSTYGSYTMDPLATRWHASLTASMSRAGGFNDALFQNNLANNLWSDKGGFSDEDNRLFIRAMQQELSVAQRAQLGLPNNLSTFHIRDHLRTVRKAARDDAHVLEDGVVHEYTRWVHLQSMLNAVHSVEQMKVSSKAQRGGNGFAPVFYGNLPNVGGLHASVVMFAASVVDVIWSEQSEDFQPGFKDDLFPGASAESKAAPARQAYSTLVYKLGSAAGGFTKPVITLEYVGAHYSDPLYPGVAVASKILPEAVYLAEATANGGIACQTDVATPWKDLFPPPQGRGGSGIQPLGWPSEAMKPHRDLNAHHAQFLHRYRGLFTDRSRVAKLALVYSLPSMIWRDWAPLRTQVLPHREHFTAAARLMEDRRIMYEVLAFGHPDFMASNASLARLADGRYTTLLLPAVDAISDAHAAAIYRWVRAGGKLVLWHNESQQVSGSRDEEMRVRSESAFVTLVSNPGSGQVVILEPQTVGAYVSGVPGRSGELLATAMGEAPGERQLELVESTTGTDVGNVWANVWRHGSGPMLSVQMVNYAVDTTGRTDAVNSTKPLRLRLNISAEHGLDPTRGLEALWVSIDYCNVTTDPGINCGAPPPPTEILAPGLSASGLLEIQIPPLQIFACVVITNGQSLEWETRLAAGEARKWLTRLRVASTRTPGADAQAVAPVLSSATELLDAVQGPKPMVPPPSQALATQLNQQAAALKQMVTQQTDTYIQRRTKMMRQTASVSAVRRFDFTGGHAPSPPGWTPVLAIASTGDGWSLECGPGLCSANHSVEVEPQGLESLFGEWIRNKDPAIPYRYGDGRSSGQFRLTLGVQPQLSPATFRVENLPAGEYVVTVITGSNGAFPVWEGPSIEGRTAMTAIEVLHSSGAAEMVSLGDRLHAGVHQFRAFPAQVKADGALTLRFSGSSVGPLYYNSIQWIVSAVILQRSSSDGPLLPETAMALATARTMSTGAIRTWRVLAPLSGNDRWDALDVALPLETQAPPNFNLRYESKLGGTIGWRNETVSSFAAKVPLMHGVPTNCSVGYAYAEHVAARDFPAHLIFSTSGVGKVFLNGYLVARDELDAGLLAAEQTIPVSLRAGVNHILVKSVNNWGFADWATHVSIVPVHNTLAVV